MNTEQLRVLVEEGKAAGEFFCVYPDSGHPFKVEVLFKARCYPEQEWFEVRVECVWTSPYGNPPHVWETEHMVLGEGRTLEEALKKAVRFINGRKLEDFLRDYDLLPTNTFKTLKEAEERWMACAATQHKPSFPAHSL